jgi:hypothetical protein
MELKRNDESTTILRVVWRMRPRNGGRSSCFARGVTRRAVTSTAGSGTAFRDGQTESGESVGDVAHGPGCAILPKAASYALRDYSALLETYRARRFGSPTCSPTQQMPPDGSGPPVDLN